MTEEECKRLEKIRNRHVMGMTLSVDAAGFLFSVIDGAMDSDAQVKRNEQIIAECYRLLGYSGLPENFPPLPNAVVLQRKAAETLLRTSQHAANDLRQQLSAAETRYQGAMVKVAELEKSLADRHSDNLELEDKVAALEEMVTTRDEKVRELKGEIAFAEARSRMSSEIVERQKFQTERLNGIILDLAEGMGKALKGK